LKHPTVEELEGTKNTFPFGVKTPPAYPMVIADPGGVTRVKRLVAVLNIPTIDPLNGTMRMRKSGRRTPPREFAPTVEATFPKTGCWLVAHQLLVGWEEALHVAEIHA
jgi:hypothetical protein